MAAVSALHEKLLKLKNCGVQVLDNHSYPEAGMASVSIMFTDGTKLSTDYWRLSKDGKAHISSFDHKQQYGLPAPINAIGMLEAELQNAKVTEAKHDIESGDLLFFFSNNIKFQALNFTSYEIWVIIFPDGTGQYSNYTK